MLMLQKQNLGEPKHFILHDISESPFQCVCFLEYNATDTYSGEYLS